VEAASRRATQRGTISRAGRTLRKGLPAQAPKGAGFNGGVVISSRRKYFLVMEAVRRSEGREPSPKCAAFGGHAMSLCVPKYSLGEGPFYGIRA